MRVQATFFVLLVALVASPGVSQAEKVKTNAKAKIYNRPGEQGTVVAKVKEGQAMTVLAKEGRWLKVRVSGRTGYVPRSKVDMPDDDEIVRNTRRRPFVDGRSTKRGFGGESPDDRIGADDHVILHASGGDIVAIEDVPLPGGIYNVFTLDAGTITRIDDFGDRHDALAAAGLES